MSSEVLEIVKGMDRQCLEWQMSMQCAPLITGCKISNLLMLPAGCYREAEALFRGSDLAWFPLRKTGHKMTVLVYHREKLAEYLRKPEIREILKGEGYPEGGPEEALEMMRGRYLDCRDSGGEFPHEMGVFLGYPADDVRGFMEHSGQKFLFSGYWKVYSRVEEKKKIFDSYEMARDTLIRLLHEGLSLRDILMIYEDFRNEPEKRSA